MAQGGARPGAGRKPGSRDKLARETAEKVAAEGVTPLDYLLSVMRSETEEPARRIDAAKAAAPYVHARLNTVDVNHGVQDSLGDLLKAVDGRSRKLPG